jgi:shikimate dehydrogenase
MQLRTLWENVCMTTQQSVLLGLIGSGIQASLTPAMHEREGAEQGGAR